MGKRLALLAALASVLVSCKGCEGTGAERPQAHMSKDAEMVVELPRLSGLADSRPQLEGLLAPIASKDQVGVLVSDLTRQIGFDPTTREGLKKAGLAADGSAAIEIIDGGRSALFVLPVQDQDALKSTLEGSERLRGRYSLVFAKPFAILAVATKNSDAIAKRAAALSHGASILDNAEYSALSKSLPKGGLVRFIAPNAKSMAPKLWQRLKPQTPADPGIEEASEKIKSTGFVLSLDKKNAITAAGRLRFEPSELERIRAVWKSAGPTPKGVLAIDDPGAFLSAMGSGDMDALIKTLSGAGLGPRVDAFVSNLKTDLGIDLTTQVLPQLSGHAGLTLGFRENADADLRAILRNPARLIWTNLALGVKHKKALAELADVKDKIDPALEKQGLVRSQREAGKLSVQSIAFASNKAVLTETFLSDDAWIFANDPSQTDAIATRLDAAKTKDPLKDGSTVAVSLRFPPVLDALRRLDIGSLVGGGAQALLMRALIAKGMLLLGTLDRAEVELRAVDDGIALDAGLYFVGQE